MTVQWSTTVRNAVVDAWESAIGISAKVEIRTGAQPENAVAAAAGTLLVSFTLAADWASAGVDGVKALTGLPITASAVALGEAGHYRITDSAGATCHEQGSVTVTGGGGDMTVDNASIAVGQSVQITAWIKTAPGA